jgi:flavin-binding protein dodecin
VPNDDYQLWESMASSRAVLFFVNFPFEKTHFLTLSEPNNSRFHIGVRATKTHFTMAVMKVIEIMADSKKSWEDAAANGIKKASKSVKNIRSAWVQDHSVSVNNGKVTSYRVTMKITFEVG